MVYDYRPRTAKKKSVGTVRPMLAGLMLGMVIGIAIAAGVAIYIARIPSPFAQSPSGETAKPHTPEIPAPAVNSNAKATEQKPYTFYDILEGNKTPKPDQPSVSDKPGSAAPTTTDDKTVFYLQAGAYQDAADADNQKAKIALLGLEARVKTATLADKGTVYRVRLGPYKSQDEATEVKSTLKENGVEAGLIKIVKSSPSTGIN
jgi:cell division protein FtsN